MSAAHPWCNILAYFWVYSSVLGGNWTECSVRICCGSHDPDLQSTISDLKSSVCNFSHLPSMSLSVYLHPGFAFLSSPEWRCWRCPRCHDATRPKGPKTRGACHLRGAAERAGPLKEICHFPDWDKGHYGMERDPPPPVLYCVSTFRPHLMIQPFVFVV